MLKSLANTGDGLFCRLVLSRTTSVEFLSFKAHISTNTAINNSLRSSRYDDHTRQKSLFPLEDSNRSSERQSSAPQREPRPNHQLGLDGEDVAHQRKVNERYKALQHAHKIQGASPKRLKSVAKEAVSQGLNTEETIHRARAQYDYSPKPGGNRATRRAAKFGHEAPSSPNVNAVAFTRRARNRRMVPIDGGEETPLGGRSGSNADKGCDNGLLPNYSKHDSEDASTSQRRLSSRIAKPVCNQTLVRSGDHAPLSIPYTTSASEFLYGTSVVIAALLSSRRKLYRLYIYDGTNREAREQDLRIRRMALKCGVVVDRVGGEWLKVMDKMSGGRPHNGFVLEASPLPKLPVVGFRPVENQQGPFHVILDHQSQEDEVVNGIDTLIKYDSDYRRYPFVLLLDGILDPGNLGAILRTAFFLGVDAVAIANRSSAPLSPVALKASAGASETLPLVSVEHLGPFLDTSKKNGWKVYAAAAPTQDKHSRPANHFSTTSLKNPLREHACIVILGSEGQGLQRNIQRKADYEVGIEGPRRGQGRVDSLNVSVAAGLLCEAFLRRPTNISEDPGDSSPQPQPDVKDTPQNNIGDLLF
ncbi:hypothetical protein ACLMJK_000475 [Lecanora helva]